MRKYIPILMLIFLMTSCFFFLDDVVEQDEYADYTRRDLNQLVEPVALYPDELLVQVLTASTYSEDIEDAADWAEYNSDYLSNPYEFADIIESSSFYWDSSIQALLPFPSVLRMMADDIYWTQQLGNAVLADRNAVMDSVQRLRRRAYDYGYLRTGTQIKVVRYSSYIVINPAVESYIVVPRYNPRVVYVEPVPGYATARAITFATGVTLGATFAPWGWGRSRIVWNEYNFYLNNYRWERNWRNRRTYRHYTASRPRPVRPSRPSNEMTRPSYERPRPISSRPSTTRPAREMSQPSKEYKGDRPSTNARPSREMSKPSKERSSTKRRDYNQSANNKKMRSPSREIKSSSRTSSSKSSSEEIYFEENPRQMSSPSRER